MVDKRIKPELLAPAGDMERLKMAVLYGADAVYLAGTDFGMRAFAGNFTPDELRQAVDYAHRHGVRVHCTINTMPRNDEIARIPEHLELLNDAGVDAVIVAVAHTQFLDLTKDMVNGFFDVAHEKKVFMDLKGLFNREDYQTDDYIYWRL